MLEQKDFATGCRTLILCVVLVPLFFVVFKPTLFLAIVLAIVAGAVLGTTVPGRIERLFITGKSREGKQCSSPTSIRSNTR